MAKIYFFEEDVSYLLKRKTRIKDWIFLTAKEEGRKVENINIILCSDAYLLELNVQHLNHNYLTDVITFPLENRKGFINGDIFISLDRLQVNSLNYKVSLEIELLRVIIHGVLHLLGYGDKRVDDRKIMKSKENYYLELFNEMPVVKTV